MAAAAGAGGYISAEEELVEWPGADEGEHVDGAAAEGADEEQMSAVDAGEEQDNEEDNGEDAPLSEADMAADALATAKTSLKEAEGREKELQEEILRKEGELRVLEALGRPQADWAARVKAEIETLTTKHDAAKACVSRDKKIVEYMSRMVKKLAIGESTFDPKLVAALGESGRQPVGSGIHPEEGFRKDLKASACNAEDFTASAFKTAGYSAAACKEAGFSLAEIKEAGYSLRACCMAGFSLLDCRNERVTGEFQPDAAPPQGDDGQDDAAPPQGDDGQDDAAPPQGDDGQDDAAPPQGDDGQGDAAPAADAAPRGYTLQEIKLAGFEARDFRAAGYTAWDCKDAGFTVREAKAAGYSSCQCMWAGYSYWQSCVN